MAWKASILVASRFHSRVSLAFVGAGAMNSGRSTCIFAIIRTPGFSRCAEDAEKERAMSRE